MADFANFTVTALSNQSVSLPRLRVECKIVDSKTGAVLRDLTGANAVTFPGVLTQLTASQRRELFDMISHWLIYTLTGL